MCSPEFLQLKQLGDICGSEYIDCPDEMDSQNYKALINYLNELSKTPEGIAAICYWRKTIQSNTIFYNTIEPVLDSLEKEVEERLTKKATLVPPFENFEDLVGQVQALTTRVNELEAQVKGINKSCSKLHAAWEHVKNDITEMFRSRDSEVNDLRQSMIRIERKVCPELYAGYDEEFWDQMANDLENTANGDYWLKYTFKKWKEFADKKKQEEASEYVPVKKSRLEKIIDFLRGKDVD